MHAAKRETKATYDVGYLWGGNYRISIIKITFSMIVWASTVAPRAEIKDHHLSSRQAAFIGGGSSSLILHTSRLTSFDPEVSPRSSATHSHTLSPQKDDLEHHHHYEKIHWKDAAPF